MMRILCRLGHHKYRLFLVSKWNGWTFAEMRCARCNERQP